MLLTGTQTAMSIGTQQRQANAVRAQGAFEEAAANRNANMADRQATDAIARGDIASNIRGRHVREAVGADRAAAGASGLDLSSGSAADVQTNEATLGALDIATIRNNAAREAWGYTSQATEYRYRGKVARAGNDAAALGIEGDEANTLITGAAKTYGLYRANADGGTKATKASKP